MENKADIFTKSVTDSYIFSDVSSTNFFLNLIIGIVLSLLVSYIYVKYGKNISNRREFASNFTLLTLTTLFIITVVKSSLALSLGLVGALSIVRFRSAIKDPEELTYLFLSIAIGLGLGANQLFITIIAIFVSIAFILIRDKFSKTKNSKFINLILSYPKSENYSLDSITELFSKYCTDIDLRRYSETDESNELCLYVNLKTFNSLKELLNQIPIDFPKILIDFTDRNGLN